MTLRSRLRDVRQLGSPAPVALLAALVVVGVLAASASARLAAAPQNIGAAYNAPGALPSVSGPASTATCPTCGVGDATAPACYTCGGPTQGTTLTALSGTWPQNPAPTSFAYQWQRCATDGTACKDITGATGVTYRLTADDVGSTVAVFVTAFNADGKGSAESHATAVVSSTNRPAGTARPYLSGIPKVGDQLSVSMGIWTPSATSFAIQWQRCSLDGSGCLNIAGATKQTYAVATPDVAHTLQALVIAHTAAGETAAAISPLNSGPVRAAVTPKKKK